MAAHHSKDSHPPSATHGERSPCLRNAPVLCPAPGPSGHAVGAGMATIGPIERVGTAAIFEIFAHDILSPRSVSAAEAHRQRQTQPPRRRRRSASSTRAPPRVLRVIDDAASCAADPKNIAVSPSISKADNNVRGMQADQANRRWCQRGSCGSSGPCAPAGQTTRRR